MLFEMLYTQAKHKQQAELIDDLYKIVQELHARIEVLEELLLEEEEEG